jgi:hypothetical protein
MNGRLSTVPQRQRRRTEGCRISRYRRSSNAPGSIGRSTVWTGQNQLASIADSFAGTASFQYGPDGELIQQSQTPAGGSTASKQYLSENTEVICGPGGTITRNYIAAPTGVIGLVVQSSSQSDQVQYLHQDNQGSIVAVSDSGGNVIQRYVYPYAGGLSVTYTAAGTRGTLTDRGYTGHRQLDAFGLVI